MRQPEAHPTAVPPGDEQARDRAHTTVDLAQSAVECGSPEHFANEGRLRLELDCAERGATECSEVGVDECFDLRVAGGLQLNLTELGADLVHQLGIAYERAFAVRRR